MNLAYKEYFGLQQEPFNITADPAFLYLSRSHSEALAQLSYGIKAHKGFVVLTGEVGTGKTTVVKALLDDLDSDTRSALIFGYIANPFDLLRYTCDEFGLRSPQHSRSDFYECLSLLNDYLLKSHQSGKTCALIIDEAQNLSSEVLESVRLLSNFETSKDKLLQILLVGQPELSTRLKSQQLRQLEQRITVRHHLRSLTLKESHEYIASRLRIAGGDPELFTIKAQDLIYQYSGGIPRVVNVICDNSLLMGYTFKKNVIDDAIVRQVAEDLNLSPMSASNWQMQSSASAQLNDKGGSLNGLHLAASEEPTTILQTKPTIAIVENLASVQPANPNVLTPFFDALTEELREVIGPMASIVLKDHIRRGGYSMEAFPKDKLEKLVETISEEIVNPYMRHQFRKKVDDRMRQASLMSYDL